MRQKTVETVQFESLVFFCDICREELLAGQRPNICDICGREVCHRHYSPWPPGLTYPDAFTKDLEDWRRLTLCDRCDLQTEFQRQWLDMQEQFLVARTQLATQWKAQSLAQGEV